MSTAELSVVIVTWNAREPLLACLRSLHDHPPPVPWETIVVDNGSRDGTAAAVADQAPDIRLIANRTNRGLAAANNQGLVAAGGESILISNPDVLYQPGAVDALLATLARRPRAAFVVPRLRYEDGGLMTSAGDLPTLGEALRGRRAQRRARRRASLVTLERHAPTRGFWWDGWSHDAERSIGRGAEAAYLVRRAAVAEIGLQDERFRLDWEGIDWTARARAAGWEIWFTPDAEVTHLGGASVRQVPYRWIVRSHLGMFRYFAPRWPRAARPLLAGLVAGRAMAKLGAQAVGGETYERGHRGPAA